MATRVVVGPLKSTDGHVLVLADLLRVTLPPGIEVPTVPSGTSLTIIVEEREGELIAKSVHLSSKLS